MDNFFRGRRLRGKARLREMLRETELRAGDFIMPYFVLETEERGVQRPIASMPGQAQLSLDALAGRVEKALDTGLKAALLFGIPAAKDVVGSGAYADNGIVQRAARLLKERHGDALLLITDICLCEYTSHGHCGVLSEASEVMNDPNLELLSRAALSHARAGADMVAPSDMLDGRVRAIRNALDRNGYTQLPIMSYAVKYASAFYGPFREAADSAPKSGNRKGYQMDPANRREAMREAGADMEEEADILMVKPAGPYLDIIREVHERFDRPLAAYQVSGEYAMIRAAGANGWLDEKAAILESLLGIKRAGADIIISYFTEELLAGGLL
jgi:porphobilinogen synthase